jgi:2'-5' RNA ligase
MDANWFIATPIAPGRWFERAASPPAGIRRFHPDDLHATVAFLGAVTEGSARAAFEALAIKLEPIDVTLGSVVAMGNPKRYSALSALIDEGRDALEWAMGECRDRAFSAAGAKPESRPPKAHVTVARPSRDASDRVRRAGLEWASKLTLSGERLRIDRVSLYTWSEERGDPSRPLFQETATVKLVSL